MPNISNTHCTSLHNPKSIHVTRKRHRKEERERKKGRGGWYKNGVSLSSIWVLISCHQQWSPRTTFSEPWPPATDWSTSPPQWGSWGSGGDQQASKSIRLIDVGATQSEVSSLAFSVPMKKIPDDEMSHSRPALTSAWLPAASVSVSGLVRDWPLWGIIFTTSHRPSHTHTHIHLIHGLTLPSLPRTGPNKLPSHFPFLFTALISIQATVS